MGQAFSAFSFLLGVAGPHHKNFAETAGIFKSGPIVTRNTGTPAAKTKSSDWNAKADTKMAKVDGNITSSDLFGASDIIYGEPVDHSKGSKSWLGPSPKPAPSSTKTAISPGPEKFQIPHDKDDMVPDCSKYDTLLMMPATESQIFKLKEDKAFSGKETSLVTKKKSVAAKKSADSKSNSVETKKSVEKKKA